MQETETDDVNVRTELNVQNSDATLIFSHGLLFGGSEYTDRMARQHGKPCLHVDFNVEMPIERYCWSSRGCPKRSLGY